MCVMEVGQCFVCVCIISAWMVIGMIGAFLFILIQLVLIVDFAHAWNEKWIGKYEDTQSKAWIAGKAAFYPCNAMLVWVLLAMTWCLFVCLSRVGVLSKQLGESS